MKVELVRSQLGDVSSSLLSHTVVLLLLINSIAGQSQGSRPTVAMLGDDITLPCHLEPAVDAFDLTVEWARPDLDPRFVHLRRDGVELLLEENPLYRGRTSLFVNQLKCGDVSLKLSGVKLSDAGAYRCLIPTSGTESVVQLVVGSVSLPEIEISKVSSGVMLECKSAGWYPEPDVWWLDDEGNLLSAEPAETDRGPDGLYTVSSRVTVDKRHSNSFTCRVQQKNINQTRETHIHVADELFMVESSSAVRITICSAVCIMTLAAAVFITWKWGRISEIKTKTVHKDEAKLGQRNTTTCGSSIELQLLMEGQTDRQQLMTDSEKMKDLEKTKMKLNEELQKGDRDLNHVKEVMKTLTEQKEDLKKQRDKIIKLQQEDLTQIKENKKKLTETPKLQKESKMQKRKVTEEALERRQKEHDELLKNTEKLLDTTETLMMKMTDKKAKLERDREQVIKYLKVTETERQELQKKLEQSEREKETKDPPSNDPV